MTFQIVAYRKLWFSLSAILAMVSVVVLVTWGLRPGIDFTGGSLMEVKFAVPPDFAALRSTLQESGYASASVQTTDGNGFLIRTETLDEPAHAAILSDLRARYGDVEELRFDSIGPMIGKELRRNAAIGIGLSLLLIGLYIAWAFRGADQYISSKSIAAVSILKAVHDVLISVGIFAVFAYFFGYEVDTAFVAAVLTILGYSINDGVVVVDRTRENLKLRVSPHFDEVVELSLHQTLSRSINTSVTVFLALLAIFLLGGVTTRPFALALLIGIAVGTYSSVFIASPALVAWEARRARRLAGQ